MIVANSPVLSRAAQDCIDWMLYCEYELDVRSELPSVNESLPFRDPGTPAGRLMVSLHSAIDDWVLGLFGDTDDIFGSDL